MLVLLTNLSRTGGLEPVKASRIIPTSVSTTNGVPPIIILQKNNQSYVFLSPFSTSSPSLHFYPLSLFTLSFYLYIGPYLLASLARVRCKREAPDPAKA